MGSQQLLLIVLGVIIVGIAVVVGISIFGSNADQANKDAMTQDIIRMAAAAQAFYHKPVMLGGGGASFNGITLADVGLATGSSSGADNSAPDGFSEPQESSSSSTNYGNANGTYAVEGNDQSCTLTGTSSVVKDATVSLTFGPSAVQEPVYTGF